MLDDWGIEPLDDTCLSGLLEILDDRVGAGSTMFTSLLPVSSWAQYIDNPSVSDSILDRVVHNSFRVELEGPSLREKPEYGALTLEERQ